ncbi:MAG: photosystem II reaction center protein PsbN [Cyanobacteria bacterium MAG CAR1_bin_15]|nr:photosystem II reaction center protein PsbN [Cyanobacteria bacterium MAG CAR1_bin_15]
MSQVSTLSPGLGLGLVVLAVLVGLTGFGLYTAFGPPAQGLSDPFDDHED